MRDDSTMQFDFRQPIAGLPAPPSVITETPDGLPSTKQKPGRETGRKAKP
jgi:hypothetical protein